MGQRAKGAKKAKGQKTKDKGQRAKDKDKGQKTQRHKVKAKIESHKAKGLDARPESRTQDAGRKGRTQDTQLQDKCKNGEVTMRVPWRDADDEEQSRRWRQVADSASQIPGYASYPIQPDEESSLRALAWEDVDKLAYPRV